jgi:hypothetical protein
MKIKKFNEGAIKKPSLDEDFDQSKEDFEISKKSTLQLIDSLMSEYEDFLNDVSPKHWRRTGHHFSELRKMKEEINDMTPITKSEKEIDWVKKQRNGEEN